MTFDLPQALTGRKPRSLDHLPLTRRYAVRISGDKEHLNNERQRTIQSLQTLSRLTGPWKVCCRECVQGVTRRKGMRHLEVLKREKQPDQIGMWAAAVLA